MMPYLLKTARCSRAPGVKQPVGSITRPAGGSGAGGSILLRAFTESQ